MSKQVGYARVSSKEQNLHRQLALLSTYVNSEFIVTDKASGKDFNRPGYQSLKVGIGKLTKGDTLIVTSLDRLGRNYKQLKTELQYFQEVGVRVQIIDIPSTMINVPEGQDWMISFINNMFIDLLGVFAEQERNKIRERQKEGIRVMPVVNGKRISLKTNRAVGRPAIDYPEHWDEIYGQWKNKQITAIRAMEILELKRNTFYNLVKRFENL